MMFEAGPASNHTLSCSVFNLVLIQCVVALLEEMVALLEGVVALSQDVQWLCLRI